MYLAFNSCMARATPECSLVNGSPGEEGGGKPRAFVTTRWSLILSAANFGVEEQKARDALAELCRTYWRPIFLFVRGRVRSLLLRSLQNFLINAAEKIRAHKRGGDVEFVSWDDWAAEQQSQLPIPTQALDSLQPERLFDLNWATTVVEHALQRLREECERKGKLWLFQMLSPHLTDERDEVSYAKLSGEMGIAETAVKKHLQNMRQRYRSPLRAEVSQTVKSPADVDDEIRYLCASLATGTDSRP